MQGLSISQWIIIAIVVVLVAGASSLFTRAIGKRERRPEARSRAVPAAGRAAASSAAPLVGNATPAGEPPPLGGWLLLLGILIFASPFLTGAWLWNVESSISPGLKQQFPITVYGQIGIYLAVIALEIGTIICLVRRSRQFKPVFVITSIALMLLLPAFLFWTAVSLALEGGRPFTYMLPSMFTAINIILCFIFAVPGLIWLVYVLRSRRVANTFVR